MINYRTEDVARKVRQLAPSGVDSIIEMDLSRNAAYYPDILKPYASCAVARQSGWEARQSGWQFSGRGVGMIVAA
ncbi:hypothetical protein FNL56_08350 [Tardiphaga sp. vice304]|uniref:hypothetical protein n=1 Tax=Tardiphaga sp. vice304 TaxID=2592817 RepID=UPI00116275B8|nr:hypothetical protein [Tardiphaga sp. vice304]QDM26092.1 hypothetical protein FNL56_08350 [Tardiphaga sp. vice304]